jgi:hypothetical protein
MTNDKRDLLDVLKTELEFLTKGGYRHTARTAWRPQFMFQDSPTCLNFDSTRQPRPCGDCVLVQLVPADLRKARIPCRFITLNEQGETIDSFYRTGTQEELEAATARWLKTTIARLEGEKAESLKASEHPEVHVRSKVATGC